MNGNIFLSEGCQIQRVMNAVAAGTTSQNSAGVSCAGFDGVIFIAGVGALTATQVTSLKLQSSSDDGSSDAYADISGAATDALADGDGNALLFADLRNPPEEYVRGVLVRGTATAVIDFMIAILYHAKTGPVTQHADIAEFVRKIGG